ncbi:MAG TPA: glycosyltransferase [Phycisphaerae bacterium]|nr:glycosyltransferase [Phycisphaerae bacterium]
MLLSSHYALHDPGDGRLMQAKRQAEALEELGHEVIRMETWNARPREDVDVLHVFEGGFGNYVLMPSRPDRFRRIVLAPFIDSNMPFWLYGLATRAHIGSRLYSAQYILRRQAINSDVVIVRSEHERHRFLRSYGVPESKVAIVLNGVNPPLNADAQKARQSLELPDKFVLHVSKYTDPRKNILRLVDAASSLNYPLVIAGSPSPGPILNDLKKREANGLIRLLNFVDRPTLEGMYAACHVFALPSTHEGTGLVALEAASCGANIVITRNGGPPHYFEKHAEYVDPSNTADIARALKIAWDKPRNGTAKSHVLNNLTWRQSAEQLVRVYEGIRR